MKKLNVHDWDKRVENFLFDEFGKKEVTINRQKIPVNERWLFCWDGEPSDSSFDCACCIDGSYTDCNSIGGNNCKCICHKRIRQLKSFIHRLLLEEHGYKVDNNEF